MTWLGLCSESVLQLQLRERGISHQFVLTIRLMMMNYGMRHYNQKSVPGIFVLVLFFFSACSDRCFCILSLWLLSPQISFRELKSSCAAGLDSRGG